MIKLRGEIVYGSDAELRMIPHPDERAGGRKNRRVEEERCARACSLA